MNSNIRSEFKSSWNKILIMLILVIIFSVTLIILVKISSRSDSANNDPLNKPAWEITFSGKNVSTLRLGHYTLWAVNAQNEFSFLKRFNAINEHLVSLDGSNLTVLESEIPATTVKFAVSIEIEGDRNEIPNDFIAFSSDQFTLAANTTVVLNSTAPNLDKVSGSYILSTPTDGNESINELSGIWFTGLNLPDLSATSWRWQGRIESASGIKLLTGLFRRVNEPDSSSKYSLNQAPGLDYPGEDLLTNLPEGLQGPLNLANGHYKVSISLEPTLNGEDFSGELPYIQVLESDIPLNTKEHTPVNFHANPLRPSLTLHLRSTVLN